MKTMYILLTRNHTFLSRLVHILTADPYTHVSLAFQEDLKKVYSSSRKNGLTMFPAGPCIENIYGGLYLKHSDIPCALYELEVEDKVYEIAKREAKQIIDRSDDYHFNILGLLFCMMNISLRRRRSYFCSQFVGEILSKSSAVELPKDFNIMRPNDYADLPGLTCVFEGKLRDLRLRCESAV